MAALKVQTRRPGKFPITPFELSRLRGGRYASDKVAATFVAR